MTDTFRKTILAVGTYHSPDAPVVVTPERLRHWESEIRRLQNAGYAIPSHYDHAAAGELLEPVDSIDLEHRRSMSAQYTVAHMQSFTVMPDGQAAEIVMQALNPAAAQQMASNALFVSPVIYPSWRDGRGIDYTDIITSVDLVDHPVDFSQTPFEPVEQPVCCSARHRHHVRFAPLRMSQAEIASAVRALTRC